MYARSRQDQRWVGTAEDMQQDVEELDGDLEAQKLATDAVSEEKPALEMDKLELEAYIAEFEAVSIQELGELKDEIARLKAAQP